MRAVLDHVGIAVADLDASLAFFRDALGLHVEASEDVAAQRVRAHFIPVGEATLELLEGTSPDSAISKYVEKRGPGLHHITLRVDDIDAVLAMLKGKGVRLIDERARPGAEQAMVGFIHPASAHSVLVELKQAKAPLDVARFSRVARFTVGDLELFSVNDGFFHLDGGAMFGVVPKPLWSRRAPADALNRITMGMRPLIVRGAQTMIIDAGMGDKESDRFCAHHGVERSRHLDHSLAEAGLAAEDIDLVLATHLHFDHSGGFTVRGADGRLRPRFPKARYLVRRGEWDAAWLTDAKSKASYFADNLRPLAEAGVVDFIEEDGEVMPGVRVQRTGGHTAHHQVAVIESGGQAAVFLADLIPMAAHVPPLWIMGYDLFPMETLAAKEQWLRTIVDQRMLVFFEHDPAVPAAWLEQRDGKIQVVPAAS